MTATESKIVKTLIATLLLILSLVLTAGGIFPETATSEKSVTTDELNSTVKIIGPLGIGIGELVSVEGVAGITGDKIVSTWVDVDHVAGRKLETPIRIDYQIYNWANITQLEKGKRLRLNVYQQIGMRGQPDGVTEQTVPVATGWKYELHTWLVVVNQTEPRPFAFPNKFYDSVAGGHPLDRDKTTDENNAK